MRTLLMITGAMAMAIAAPALAEPGKGQGGQGSHGQGRNGQGNAEVHGKGAHAGGPGQGNGRGNAGRDTAERAGPGRGGAGPVIARDEGRGNADRAGPGRGGAGPVIARDEGRGNADRAGNGRGRDRADGVMRALVRGDAQPGDRAIRRDLRDMDRGRAPVDVTRRLVRNEEGDGLRALALQTRAIPGCPPGLARKNNGCLPPGQARKLYTGDAAYARWFDDVPLRYRAYVGDGYRYGDGYLYRLSGNGIAAYLPLLGGALGVGQLFPADYYATPVPQYYVDYYGRNDDYLYRYADNALFAVDPETRMIQSIAALLTGDDWAVGQPVPSGYSVYNVPLAYRATYADTPEWNYRYADGYVYRIDPETQLVAAAISLLT